MGAKTPKMTQKRPIFGHFHHKVWSWRAVGTSKRRRREAPKLAARAQRESRALTRRGGWLVVHKARARQAIDTNCERRRREAPKLAARAQRESRALTRRGGYPRVVLPEGARSAKRGALCERSEAPATVKYIYIYIYIYIYMFKCRNLGGGGGERGALKFSS